jgi:hypothetical protein
LGSRCTFEQTADVAGFTGAVVQLVGLITALVAGLVAAKRTPKVRNLIGRSS